MVAWICFPTMDAKPKLEPLPLLHHRAQDTHRGKSELFIYSAKRGLQTANLLQLPAFDGANRDKIYTKGQIIISPGPVTCPRGAEFQQLTWAYVYVWFIFL